MKTALFCLILIALGTMLIISAHDPVSETATPSPVPSDLQLPDPVLDQPVLTIPPCVMEDDQNCYWDASVRGNGAGTSFINLDGVYYYPVTR